ncbi:ATP-binding protein [Methylovorus sp. SPW-M1]
MSLKLRLNLMITALLVLIMALGTMLMVANARQDVRAEVESTAKLALYLLDAEALYYSQLSNPQQLRSFRLKSLSNLRHLRIEFYDHNGTLVDSNSLPADAVNEAPPPRWFVSAMGMVSSEWIQSRRMIKVNGRVIGVLVVTPDPSYEIAEVWGDTQDLLVLSALFFLLVNLMVYWAVGHALRPVDTVLAALNELERGNLKARLPDFKLKELARISHKFNLMAHKLETSVERNHRLSQQLIRAQEDERKHLARDLHDEIGQSLTAINADATAIVNSDSSNPRIKESAAAIVQVARHVVTIVRDMLEHLRPDTLDKLGLHIALTDLVSNWRQRHPQATITINIEEDLEDLGEFIPITIYRLLQEALTNISRHARAGSVSLAVQRMGNHLHLVIRDNGCGFEMEKAPSGFGLAGMRERVEGLGGKLDVQSAPGEGTTIMVSIPVINQQELSGE